MRPLCRFIRRPNHCTLRHVQRRLLLTLAIETSCDDTSVAVLEKHKNNSAALHFHSKITSDNRIYGGVHPIASHESHQQNLATLVEQALHSLPIKKRTSEHITEVLCLNGKDGMEFREKPDFITVTRGPGMRSSLNTGLDTAKGLAVAWQIPLLGVNHMQAHALTPRLVSALDAADAGEYKAAANDPAFPFLTLLVSGGHTMLVHSRSLCDHEILANTTDMAVGDMIDKTAREVLPQEHLNSASDVMYGKLLESFAFADQQLSHDYHPPSSFTRPRISQLSGSDWTINPPYCAPGPEGSITFADAFTFSGIGSSVKGIMDRHPEMDEIGRRVLARETMALAFEHLASRALFALQRPDIQDIRTLVVSGGVASNQFLKTILRENLDVKGYKNMKLVFPPPKFCTDNAAMIAWTGIEMFEAGWRTSLDAMAIKKWSIDQKAADGGILGADGWKSAAVGH
ncbi:glycoprotease family protein-like protein [Stipitochalara longipes BDJ]|nr:glycoprotease family protein-like protein [Stipitochalara longipes BDJ]